MIFKLQNFKEALYNVSFIGDSSLLDLGINSFSLDSRNVEENTMFFALQGDRVNGFDFIQTLLEQNRQYFIVDKKYSEQVKDYSVKYKSIFIVVNNVEQALIHLAKYVIHNYPSLIRIGITGSNGKTTVKEMLHTVLSEKFSTIANKGNLNSNFGLPISLLNIDSHHQVGIFEMGISEKNEMNVLQEIYQPKKMIITHLALAHSAYLGDLESIAREKTKSLLSANEAYIENSHLLYQHSQKYNINNLNVFDIKDVSDINITLTGSYFTYKNYQFFLPLLGLHNISNVLPIIDLAYNMGMSYDQIQQGLNKVQSSFARMSIKKINNIHFLQDCYNANLSSTIALFKTLKELKLDNMSLVLSGFKELGSHSEQEHMALKEYILQFSFKHIYLVGKELHHLFLSLKNDITSLYYQESREDIEETVIDHLKADDFLILKGSRYYQLEKIIEKFERNQ